MRKRVLAFTLIELLVVIAIIAILAAILFPVFSQAKATAKQAACMSNMRQVNFAIHLYMGDQEDTWPCGTLWNDNVPGYPGEQSWIGWDNSNGPYDAGLHVYGRMDLPAQKAPRPGAIDPYLKDHAVKKCPAQDGKAQMVIASNWFSPYNNSGMAFYQTHAKALGQEFGPMNMVAYEQNGVIVTLGANDSQMDEPANTLVAWEHSFRVPECNFLQQYDWFDSPPNDPVLLDHFKFLHRNGSNTIWGDMHSKHMIYGALRRPWFSMRKNIYD